MVKTTIKYVTNLPYKSSASYFIKHLPDLIQFLILIALVLTFAEYRKANNLTQKSLSIGQKNVELSEASIKLTQQSLDATKEALKYAQAANDITSKGLNAGTTAWVDIKIESVKVRNFNSMDIRYILTNHSDVPAENVFTQCILPGDKNNIDRTFFGERDPFVLMPKGEGEFTSNVMVADPKSVMQKINSGDVGIEIFVCYHNPLGKRVSFVESFTKQNGNFAISQDFDTADSKIETDTRAAFGLPPITPKK